MMDSQPVSFNGVIQRVFLARPQDGLAIFLATNDAGEEVKLIGRVRNPRPGQRIIGRGRWKTNRLTGDRELSLIEARLEFSEALYRTDILFRSGLMKMLGPYARKKLSEQGEGVLEQLRFGPQELAKRTGLALPLVYGLRREYLAAEPLIPDLVKLVKLGLNAPQAGQVARIFGVGVSDLVARNPYVIADTPGIGFRTMDKLALAVGLEPDSRYRMEAATSYLLDEASKRGHTTLPLPRMVKGLENITGLARDKISAHLLGLSISGRVLIHGEGEARWITEPSAHQVENEVAGLLVNLMRQKARPVHLDLSWIPAKLSDEQRAAVVTAAQEKVSMLIGGAGSGKTTAVKSILEPFLRANRKVVMLAPTGRAASRMQEATGLPGQTIHLALEYQKGGGFSRDADNPLDADLIVVDEFSMVDIYLFRSLLRAVPPHARIVLVGDSGQLASVGPGAVLADLQDSGVLPVTKLGRPHRQAEGSDIVTTAIAIREGRMPVLKTAQSDCLWIDAMDDEDIQAKVVDLVTNQLPAMGFEQSEIQVITPQHKTPSGVYAINNILQDKLNPDGRELLRQKDFRLRIGDRVIQTDNDYTTGLMNGYIGRLVGSSRGEAIIDFEMVGRTNIPLGKLNQVRPAEAISIHRSQGSEYGAVVVPVSLTHARMLSIQLLYTAITRGKQQVILVGQKEALKVAIDNVAKMERFTGLRDALRLEARKCDLFPDQNDLVPSVA